jgi:ABC-2 type transport system permease protein
MIKKIINHQLYLLVLSYFKEMIREPGILFWGIAFPILMSLGLGIAFSKKQDIERKIAVIYQTEATGNQSDSSSKIMNFLNRNCIRDTVQEEGSHNYNIEIPDEKMGNTTLFFQPTGWEQALVMLKRGNIGVIMEEKNGIISYHFDPLNPDAQLTYLKLTKLFGTGDTQETESNDNVEPLTVVGTRYIDFLVPGLIAMGVMMSCMWGLSYGIIEKRSKKLLRRMVATPMKKSYFLIGLITVRVTMNFIESGLLFLFSWIVFGITIQGNIPALLLLFIAGNIAFAGIAVFFSSHTSSTEVGNGFINAVVMPMMVLSGVFFSYHNFPDWSISFIQKLPLTMLADGIRSIIIEGAGMMEISASFFVLLTIGIVFFAVGLRIFKWY